MKLKQHLIVFFLAFLVLLGTACSSSTDDAVLKEKAATVQVRVEKPSTNIDQSISLSGQIESVQTANISTRVMGYITSVKVGVGDHVNKGQLLVTISNEDIQARLAQADAMISGASASLKSAEKDQQRFINLYNQNSASAKELDNVTLQYQAAKAGLQSAVQMKAEARAMLAYTNITAPFSGVVSQKLADAGSLANPGMPVLVLEQNKSLQVKATIPETEISRVQLKSKAIVSIKSIDKTYTGTIVEISPSSIMTGGQYVVKISLPSEAQNNLQAGMYTQVSITTKDKATIANTGAVLVPLSAVTRKGQLNALYVMSPDHKALLRYVRLGKTYGSRVEILSGLNNDEAFIAYADGNLDNGTTVRVR